MRLSLNGNPANVVSENGIEIDKKKIEAITNWPTPVTVTG